MTHPWSETERHWFQAHFEFADLERLLSLIVAMPYPRPQTGAGGSPFEFDRALHLVNEMDLLVKDGTCGWLTRSGKILACGYANHDRLLYWLGLDTGDVESAGWVRLADRRRNPGHDPWQATQRPSHRQLSRLRKLGIDVPTEALRLLPATITPIVLPEDDLREIRQKLIGEDLVER